MEGGKKMNISRRGVNSRLGWLVLGLLAIVLVGLLAIQGCTPSAQDITRERQPGPPPPTNLPPAPEVGRLAPDFTLVDLEGNQVSLSDFRGKTVFINFWATWCPPCRAEMPEIEAVYQEYKNKDVVVIGVDLQETEGEVRQFVQRGGYSWIFVIDATGEVANNYRITAIPTSFFVDKEGIIRAINVGAMTKKTMESKLAEAMK